MKFRVYDNVDKKYVGTGISNNLFVITQSGLLFDYNLKGTFEEAYPDRYTVEFSTGLKDKNGVDIYEGDTIVFDDGFTKFSKKYDVRLTKGCCWNIWHKDTEEINCSLYHAVFDHGIKIIGNIHGGSDER